MSSASWRCVGKVKEAHGLKGELKILVFSRDYSWIESLTHFALGPLAEQKFQFQSARNQGDFLVLKAVEVKDRTMAEALKGLLFHIPSELLISQPGEQIFLHEIHGFTVINADQNLGSIIDFSSNGPQDLLVVETSQGKVEIPFVEAFIQDIDFAKREVHMTLPEGLLEINRA